MSVPYLLDNMNTSPDRMNHELEGITPPILTVSIHVVTMHAQERYNKLARVMMD